ncbi:General transcription factor IIF subunit 2 [Homalodisca vitripennis]|nr:General transcription factor IIF subunit 2 [Homalodisca vitripennis]
MGRAGQNLPVSAVLLVFTRRKLRRIRPFRARLARFSEGSTGTKKGGLGGPPIRRAWGLEKYRYMQTSASGHQRGLRQVLPRADVPKYIANRWEKAPGNIEVGKLKITKNPGQKAQVSLSLSESVLCLKEPGEENIPKDHRLDVSMVTKQTLGVFSHYSHGSSRHATYRRVALPRILLQWEWQLLLIGQTLSSGRGPAPFTKSLTGAPVKASSQLLVRSVRYTHMMLSQSKKHNSSPARLSYTLPSDKKVQSPRDNSGLRETRGMSVIEYEERKKTEGKKARDDKDVVLEMLFAAFEKHQYYNIKDLVKKTRQPVVSINHWF